VTTSNETGATTSSGASASLVQQPWLEEGSQELAVMVEAWSADALMCTIASRSPEEVAEVCAGGNLYSC
jgi:hypothetical protein